MLTHNTQLFKDSNETDAHQRQLYKRQASKTCDKQEQRQWHEDLIRAREKTYSELRAHLLSRKVGSKTVNDKNEELESKSEWKWDF
jgi:hypothetical protein